MRVFACGAGWRKKWRNFAMPNRSRTALPHLQRDRLGTYYFRLTVAGRTLRRSLGTKDRALATMLASKLNWEWAMSSRRSEPSVASIIEAFNKDGRKFDAEFADGTKITGIESDDDLRRAKELMRARAETALAFEPPASRSQPQAPARVRHKGKPFSQAHPPYLAEKQHDNDQKTREDKKATFTAFAAQFGDPRMGEIDKAMAVAFKQRLMNGPAGADRINKKIGHMGDFFAWAIDNGLAAANPFEGIRISRKSKLMEAVESYEPFSAEEISTIFNRSTWKAYAVPGKPHFHWLPFLLAYTGARPNELAGIALGDIRKEQGVDYFTVKAAKNSNSQRKIPFHRALLDSGFMAYLEQRRGDDPDGQLFPLLKPTKNGHAKNVSRRFNESYLPTLRINDPRRRLYSFRATFITRMSELNVNPAMLMALVGHYEQSAVDLSSPHFKNYQGAKRVAALRDTMDLFDMTLPMVF